MALWSGQGAEGSARCCLPGSPTGRAGRKEPAAAGKNLPCPSDAFSLAGGRWQYLGTWGSHGGVAQMAHGVSIPAFPQPATQPCLSGGLLVLLSSEGGRRCWAGALHVYQHVCFLCQGCTAWLRCQQKAFSERFLEGRCDEQFKAQADRINQARPVAALGRRWISPCGSDDIVLLNIPRFSHPQARFM